MNLQLLVDCDEECLLSNNIFNGLHLEVTILSIQLSIIEITF